MEVESWPFVAIPFCAFILALTAALTIQGRACSQILKTEQMRMLFDIDPSIPFERLLPMPPKIAATGGPLFSDDLAEVPEVHLQDPLVFPPLGPDKKQTEERKKAWRGWLDGVYKDHGNHPVIQTALQMPGSILSMRRRPTISWNCWWKTEPIWPVCRLCRLRRDDGAKRSVANSRMPLRMCSEEGVSCPGTKWNCWRGTS